MLQCGYGGDDLGEGYQDGDIGVRDTQVRM